MEDADVKLYQEFQRSPFVFIEKMWGLTPQPVDPVYQQAVDFLLAEGAYSMVLPEHFLKFERGKHITWQQFLVVHSVMRAVNGLGLKKISVVSGHGIGKDAILSMLILWYLFCHKDAQVPCTAPTADLLHDVLWKELNVWLGKMPPEIAALYEWSAGYVRIKEAPETWFARARTARKEAPEAIAGVHGEFVFIPVDEASGVPDEVFKTAEGSLTGENVLVVLISNGTRTQGYFYNTHNDDKANWVNMQFDSEQSPIVDHEYVARMEGLYGRDSDEFKIRVSGKFPNAEQMDEGGWIPLITPGQVAQISEGIPFIGRVKVGIDPSGEGDDTTVWVARDRFQARVVATEATSNEKTIARKTVELQQLIGFKPADVTVDNFGVGANVAKELLLIDHTFAVNAVNWGDKPQDEAIYINKRAESHFRGREWLIRGGAVVGDRLKQDITGIDYTNNLQGRKKIMDKPKIRVKLGRSPDRGDAFFLTFVQEPEAQEVKQDDVREPAPLDPFSAI